MSFSLSKVAKGLAVGGVAATMAAGAFAAVQGPVGFTSAGSLDINIIVNDEVKISNLIDINLGTFAGLDSTGTSPACIYRNGGNTVYQITGTGSGAAGAFTLSDAGNTNSVDYAVDYTANAVTASLVTGVALTGRDGAVGDQTCAVGDNASIDVTVTAADAAALPQGTYSGTLTLVVAPN